jgi:hypothetical protein
MSGVDIGQDAIKVLYLSILQHRKGEPTVTWNRKPLNGHKTQPLGQEEKRIITKKHSLIDGLSKN